MEKVDSRVVYNSTWKNANGWICHVHSERKHGDRHAHFWFTGYNPFPCFSMESTAVCIIKWLEKNGWHRELYTNIFVTNEVIDDAGKVLDHTTHVYHYIPVRETAPEEEEFIEVLEDDEEYFD